MKLQEPSKNLFHESMNFGIYLPSNRFSRCSFRRILRQISVTEPRLCAFDLAGLRRNDSSRFAKQVFGRSLHRVFILSMLFMAVLSSCRKDEKEPETTAGASGCYVTNEGSFGNNNASVSFISSSGKVLEDPYFDRNNVPVGDVLQSLAFSGDKGFAVVNNSQKVVVFNATDFTHIGQIEGADYPRHMLVINDQKAYLTNGSFSGDVKVVNLNNYTIESSISVGKGPENMVRWGNYVFVANSGGWDHDNTVTVIDATSDAVVSTIETGDRPVDLVATASGDIWVLCAGKVIYDESWNIVGHSAARIVSLDGSSLEVEWNRELGALGDHPDDMAISPDGLMVYVNHNGIRRMTSDGADFPGEVFITGSFNSLDVHPSSGEVWITEQPDFISNSDVFRYSSSGALLSTYQAGIGANGVFWK